MAQTVTRSLPFPASVLELGESLLLNFVQQQRRDFGGTLEIADDSWALLAFAAGDNFTTRMAARLIEGAPFPHEEGESEDSTWRVHYVSATNLATAQHWLDDVERVLTGRTRLPSPSQLELIGSLPESPMPHRVARDLAEQCTAGALPVAAINDADTVRHLLDLTHRQEPLFLAAFQTLLQHHLFDLRTLYAQITDDEIGVQNDLIRGSVSAHPFFKTRQDTAVAIRDLLIRGKIINPLDQRKHTDVANPYSSLVDLRIADGQVVLTIDSIDQRMGLEPFRESIREIRKRVYLGENPATTQTNAPWVTETTAYPLRYLRRQMALQPGVSALEWLHLIESAL